MPDPVPNPIAAQVTTPPPPSAVQNPQAGLGPEPPTPPVMPGPTPPVPQTTQPQVQGPSPWQRAVHALLGSTTEYQQTPQGPQPVQVPNKPGNLFRSILAGAILGAGAGTANSEHNAGSGWGAAGAGARAVQANQQQQAQLRAAQAQKQWENQRQANQDSQEEQVRKAQITMYNMQKLKAIQEIQGGDYTSHKQLVEDAAPKVASYNASGLKPVKENISESDYEKLKDTPGWTGLDWQPVGVDHYVDPKTNLVNYQTVWNAYDPKGKITITPSMWADWKTNGVLDKEPSLVNVLKPDENGNRTLPYSAFTKLDSESMAGKAANKQKAADDYTTKEQTLNLQHLQAQINQERATAAASGDEAALRSFELKQERAGSDAETALTKNGGDWTKLTPQQKVALQPQVQKDIEGFRTELSDPLLKEQLGSDDPAVKKAAQDRASQLQEQLDNARSHSIFVPPTPAASVGGGGGIPAGAQIAVNPQTGEKRYSIDGGKTWLSPGKQGPSPTDKVLVKRADGSTYVTTQAEYQQALANPNPTLSDAQNKANVGTVIGPAPPPPTDQQRLAGMNLTAGNSY